MIEWLTETVPAPRWLLMMNGALLFWLGTVVAVLVALFVRELLTSR